jgi:hypothetical protein
MHADNRLAPVMIITKRNVKDDCCGDSVLGFVLYEKGIELSGMWPMFNAHPLAERLSNKLSISTNLPRHQCINRSSGQHKARATVCSLSEQYMQMVKDDCCGDSVLGFVLYEKGIELSGMRLSNKLSISTNLPRHQCINRSSGQHKARATVCKPWTVYWTIAQRTVYADGER